ncbi:MAG: hypothetical protein EOO41_03910 [Methanobacteriota archaeon]|nr:MAG: hypothetical protein EOO41_03910 [Euryarchaeota archaeon]
MSPPAAPGSSARDTHQPSPQGSTSPTPSGTNEHPRVRRTWPGYVGLNSSSDEECDGAHGAGGRALWSSSPRLAMQSPSHTTAPAAADAQTLLAALGAQVVSVNAAEGEMEALSNLGALLGEPCADLWPGVSRIRSFWAMSMHCACCAARQQQRPGDGDAAWLADVDALPSTLRAFAVSSTCMRLQQSEQAPSTGARVYAPVENSSTSTSSDNSNIPTESRAGAPAVDAPLVHVHAVLQTYKWLGLHEPGAARLPPSVLNACAQGIELACRMLAIDPARRISAAAAAAHPFCSGAAVHVDTAAPPAVLPPQPSPKPDEVEPCALPRVGTKRTRPASNLMRDAAAGAGEEAASPAAAYLPPVSMQDVHAAQTDVTDVLSWVKLWETQSALAKSSAKDYAEDDTPGSVCGGGMRLFGGGDAGHEASTQLRWRRPFQMFGDDADSPTDDATDGGARVLRFQ